MTTPEQPLLPCPFCGGDACDEPSRGSCGSRYMWCTRCGAQGPDVFLDESETDAWNMRADPPEQARIAEQVTLNGIEPSDGFWRSCSGCHETSDGSETGWYPYSKVFGCYLGAGCRECGGLGAVWDSTDYEALATYLAQQEKG